MTLRMAVDNVNSVLLERSYSMASSKRRKRSRPRASSASKLTKRFQVRCSPAEYATWATAARTNGMNSAGAFVRFSANKMIESSGGDLSLTTGDR